MDNNKGERKYINSGLAMIVCAAIAALISLVVAAFNYQSTTNLAEVSRTYDILRLDMDRLETIYGEIGTMVLPNMPTTDGDIDAINLLPDDAQNQHWQALFDKQHFSRVATLMRQHIFRFSSARQSEIDEKVNEVMSANGLIALGLRHEFHIWSVQLIAEQIKEVRDKLDTHNILRNERAEK